VDVNGYALFHCGNKGFVAVQPQQPEAGAIHLPSGANKRPLNTQRLEYRERRFHDAADSRKGA
jgi:hypothetical protein